MPHNGGKTQVNLGYCQTGFDFPFMNACKSFSALETISSARDSSKFDDNGYMTVLHGGGIYAVGFIPLTSERPGNWVLLWDDGDATTVCAISMSRTIVSGTLGGANGRVVFTPNERRVDLRFTTLGTPYPKNFRIVHASDEAALALDPLAFTANFKTRATRGVLRFMQKQNTNTTQVNKWSGLTPSTHFTFEGNYYKSAISAGTTTHVGDAYASSFGAVTLTDGEQVIVVFDATASGYSATFNRNGTGAKPILFADGRVIAFDVWKPSIGRIGILTYNLALDAWIKHGGDTEAFNQGLNGGWPVSVILKLCKEVGAHPWFCIPHMALDPLSDYTTELATACKAFTDNPANSSSWMIPRYEPSNEIWNTLGGFYQTRYAWSIEDKHIGSNGNQDEHNWYGRAAAKVFKAISVVYGNDRTKYRTVNASQAYGDTTASLPRLNSTRYLTEGGVVAGDAAKFWTTTGSVATYWGPDANEAETQALADEYATATTARKAAIVREYAFMNGSGTFTMAAAHAKVVLWQAAYAARGVTQFEPYEGGLDYDLTYGDANFEALTNAFFVSSSLHILVQQHFLYMASIGVGFPSKYFLSQDVSASYATWGLYRGSVYQTPSSEETAMLDYDLGKLKMRLQCAA